MKTEIDWSKAPEGATHWTLENDVVCQFIKYEKSSDKWYWFCSAGEWCPYSGERDEFTELRDCLLIARPAEWTGQGLPPVGTVCEVVQVSSQPHDYCRRFVGQNVKIVAHHVDVDGDEVAVFAASDYEFHALVAGCFRPIRTPEQIAADEREKAIAEMSEAIKTQFSFGWVFEKLYDAGYRKHEQHK